jgi:hypothetical protein
VLTKANRNDVTQVMPLLQAIPPIAGQRGAPRRKPELIQADRAYDSDPLRNLLAEHGIDTQIARRYTPHGAAAWARPAGWWSAPSRGCTSSDGCECAASACLLYTRPFLKLGACLICWRFVKAV